MPRSLPILATCQTTTKIKSELVVPNTECPAASALTVVAGSGRLGRQLRLRGGKKNANEAAAIKSTDAENHLPSLCYHPISRSSGRGVTATTIARELKMLADYLYPPINARRSPKDRDQEKSLSYKRPQHCQPCPSQELPWQ